MLICPCFSLNWLCFTQIYFYRKLYITLVNGKPVSFGIKYTTINFLNLCLYPSASYLDAYKITIAGMFCLFEMPLPPFSTRQTPMDPSRPKSYGPSHVKRAGSTFRLFFCPMSRVSIMWLVQIGRDCKCEIHTRFRRFHTCKK